jgi:U3 small nucleolar ribonucleoprotein protein IMP4
MILLTTSRRPTGKIRTFCRDLANSIPDIIRVNRGKMSLDGVAEKAIEVNADHVIIVDRHHSTSGTINLFQVLSNGLKPVPPVILLSGICLQRELKEGTKRQCSSVITIKPKDLAELKQFAWQMSRFLGLPILSMDKAIENHRVSMHFLLDFSRRLQVTFMILNRMVEIGPRLTLSRLVWEVRS